MMIWTMDWTTIGAIAAVLAVIVGTLSFLYTIRKDISAATKTEPKQSKLTVLLRIIFGKIVGPSLKIKVKDINCNVSITNFSDGTSINPRQRVQWYVDCLVEFRNSSFRTANNLEVTIELQIDKVLLENQKVIPISQLSARGGSHRETITFKSQFFDEQRLEYPDASYELRISYTCKEYPGIRKTKTKGKLSKADWKGDNRALSAIRN
jgi:hypothetical protein